MKKFSFLFFALFSLFLFTPSAEAKVLPQASKAVTKTTSTKVVTGSGIGVSPRIRSDRRALIIYFSNLKNAKFVSYLLTYRTNEQEEGAMGSLTLNGTNNQTAELLFGTCSKNVCRYHTGIKDMRLEVTYTAETGKKYIKKYKIKL